MMKRNNKLYSLKEQTPIMVMLAPFTVLFLLFTVIPILSSVVLSFTSYDLLNTPVFIGIENFTKMFVQDEVFGTVIKNTLIFAVISGPWAFCSHLCWRGL